MDTIVKSVLLLALISLAAIAVVLNYSTWSKTFDRVREVAHKHTSAQPKDAARLATLADDNDDQASLLIKLAQASRQPDLAQQAIQTAQAFVPPPAFGAPAGPHGAFGPFSPPAAMAPPPRPLTRLGCKDRINSEAASEAAMSAYLQRKLRLQPNQREAWQKLENAAQATIEKLHATCENLPTEANAPLSLPDMMDMMEAQLSVRVELLRATREPLRTLFATLTPEQRGALQPLAPPPPRP